MAPANGENTKDLEQQLLPSAALYDDEKGQLSGEDVRPQPPSSKMPSTRRFLVALLLLSVLTVTIVSALPNNLSPSDLVGRPCAEEQRKFRELVDSIEATSLHEILSQFVSDKYKHGIFPEERTAMVAVHEQNAAEASSLIELAKRQGTNSTTAESTPTSASSSSVVETTTAASTTATVAATTSDQASSQQTVAPTTATATTTEQNTQTTTDATTAATTDVTTKEVTTTAGVTETTSATVENTSTVETTNVVSTTDSSSPTTADSTATTTAETTAKTTAKTTALASSASSATTKAQSTSSRTTSIVYTTTFANGGVSTMTAVTVVPAASAGADNTAGGASGTSTSTGKASLQTGAASSYGVGTGLVLGMVGIAVIGAL